MPVICGDCLKVMKNLDGNSIDSIVTDPPAGISFMGKKWDGDRGGRDQWIEWMAGIANESLRVIKPGGHALVWALPRTSHWTATAWENAGWEVRDRLGHIFGSGFPKSLDVSKAIDKAAGVEREVIGSYVARGFSEVSPTNDGRNQWAAGEVIDKTANITAPATNAAKQWQGWGTALKPAIEDWYLLRKPLEGTVAQNVLKWGTGAINIDGCRVPIEDDKDSIYAKNPHTNGTIGENGIYGPGKKTLYEIPTGRFPAHLIHDGSEEVLEVFPETGKSEGGVTGKLGYCGANGHNPGETAGGFGGSGSASRFFYCAKPSPSERNLGLEDFPNLTPGDCTNRKEDTAGLNSPRAGAGRSGGSKNSHPTVKSIKLMRYLCRLITPPNGIILDPFCGSGSTGVAALQEGFNSILIDIDEEYCRYSRARMKGALK